MAGARELLSLQHLGARAGRSTARQSTACSGPGSACACAECGRRKSERAAPELERLHGIGRPLDASTRAQMERRFDHDFSDVRVHDGADASASARALNADAYTFGNHVVLGAGGQPGEGLAARRLLAHELAHVVQQHSAARDSSLRPAPLHQDPELEREADSAALAASYGRRPRVRGRLAHHGVQRRVTPNYPQIEERLTYRVLLDWVITDQEAREVLEMLAGLSERDLADTVAAMDRDGLVERLLDNVADEDHQRYTVLIAKVTRWRSTEKTSERIIDRLSYGVFDWKITDQDAHEALDALMGLESQQLRTVIARLVNERKFDRLMENISADDQKRYAAFIERLRRLQQEFLALVTSHVGYLRGKPGGAGEAVKETTETTGYGGAKATWPDLAWAVKEQWRRRAAAAVASVRKSVIGTPLNDIVVRSKFQFEPEEIEKNTAYAYVSGRNTLFFGTDWVEDAEYDPQYVWQSVSHELGGHEEFGDTWSWEIMKATIRRLTPAERRRALQSANSLFSAYGYLETEIYAELRELPFRVEGSKGDRPESVSGEPGDVHNKLVQIREAFGPEVGKQIVTYLYYRVSADPKVAEVSKKLLYTEVQDVFGLFPLSAPLKP